MANDPYQMLDVPRTASTQEIKDSFRKLTRKHHPDLNPDDPGAADRFKEMSAAHDLLSDPEKRRRFDAGEIDAMGQEQPQQRYWRDYAENRGDPAYAGQGGFASDDEMDEFLSRVFGGRGGGHGRAGQTMRAPGQDAHYTLAVGFVEAAVGATRTINLPDGRTLSLTIPAGAGDRQILRLKGQGMPGYGGGPAGDGYVELKVEPHAYFRRKDDNIHVELPVTLKEAVLGDRIEVPTIDGPVALTVPHGSNTGRTLRLRDKGVPNARTGRRGHQYVTLKVVLPQGEEPELAAFLESWQPRDENNPRREMLS